MIDAAAAVAAAMPDESRPPRKRRRRRRGQRVEGAAETAQGTNGNGHAHADGKPAAPHKRPQAAARTNEASAESQPSLLSRIGARLRKLVTRAPHSQH